MAQTRLKSGNLHMIGGDNGTTGNVIKSKGDGTMEWGAAIDPPTFSSVDYPGNDTALDPAGSQSLVVNGGSFNTGVTCTIDGTTPSSITRNSATQMTVTTPAKAAGTYALVISNTDGGSATVASAVSYNGIPAFTHAAGTLGDVTEEVAVSLSVVATEPDGGAVTHTIASGSLPSGLSLNASTGAITGTAPSVSANTTSNFTITATDNENQSVDRAYSITVLNLTPADHFNVVKYAGDGADNHAIATVGFKPDFVWVKELDDGNENHNLYDSTRGVTKFISTNSTNAESSGASRLKSFDDLGFTMGNDNENNDSGANYVAWCWKANGGSTVSNTDGTITSTVQANTALGFSIVKYAGNITAGATVGHGLGVAPSLIILKNIDRAGYGWLVYHQSVSPTASLTLNNGDAKSTNIGFFNNTATTSSVFSLGGDTFGNYNGDDYIAYCFADIDGFSKHGSYTGTGDSYGQIVETGFEPAFLMVKKTSDTGGWIMFDNARNTTNPRNNRIEGNNNQAEQTGSTSVLFDFYSNGFQAKGSNGEINASGAAYAYIAFADPADTTTPTLADSFSTVTYTGNGAARSITGLGFKPNLVWSKGRSVAYGHILNDSLRGISNNLSPNNTDAQSASTIYTSLDSDGYSLDGSAALNQNNATYVAWAWKAKDDMPTIYPPTQTVNNIKSTNLKLNLNLAGGSYPGSGTDLIDLSAAGEDFSRGSGGNIKTGYGGYYIDLEGNDQYWTSDSSVATTTGNDITIEFWVRSESSSAQPSHTNIMDANHSTAVSGSTGQGWAIQMRGSTQNSFYFVYYDGSGYQSNSDGELFELTVDAWTHIAIVKSGTGIQVYENGVAGTSWTAGSATIENPNQKIRLGQYLNSDARGFLGSLAQVRLYSDALSSSEVTANYNATKDLFTVATSVVSVNANAGFSIVQFTTPASPGANTRVQHGLSAAPDFIVVKRTDGVEDWYVYHTSMGLNRAMRLNSTIAEGAATNLFNTVNATVFNPAFTGTGNMEVIAYCFHSVAGYSKFGTYDGTGGSFTVTTGFQPDFVMIKRTDSTGSWVIVDSPRDAGGTRLYADSTSSEHTSQGESFSSTGFSPRTSTTNDTNTSGGTYVYAAFKIN